MTLRNGIKRGNQILAECPLEGICQILQAGKRVLWSSCGYYKGCERSRRGVKVRCEYKEEI